MSLNHTLSAIFPTFLHPDDTGLCDVDHIQATGHIVVEVTLCMYVNCIVGRYVIESAEQYMDVSVVVCTDL